MAEDKKLSNESLAEATRDRAKFSGHGNAKGAAGDLSDSDDHGGLFLGTTGDTHIADPVPGGYDRIRIGGAWQNIKAQEAQKSGFFQKVLGKAKAAASGKRAGVDLDIGCLYEMQTGERGAIQAFGEMFGDFNKPPFIALSGDDRTGDDDDDDDGEDEVLMINGKHWNDIKRLLVYFYIYDGAANWAQIQPQVQIRLPGQEAVIIKPHTFKSELGVCAVAGLENIRGGIKMTNFTEYFPGHAEMDRAHGYGLEWDDGEKS